jgi:formylglycine-generating enzyme required for sulfatase activity
MVVVLKEKPSDPKTFYMMEDKVWNALYEEFVKEKREELRRTGMDNPGTIKGEWVDGGCAPGLPMDNPKSEKLGVDGDQRNVPVFRVTVTEAFLFAQWLGGKLPTKDEWERAAGMSRDIVGENENSTGPFEGTTADLTELAVNLGLTGPQPVGQAKRDVSRSSGCRNMSGNGFEWTRDLQHSKTEKVPAERGTRDTAQVLLVGQDYLQDKPLTYAELRKAKAQKYLETSASTSFRVVIDRD